MQFDLQTQKKYHVTLSEYDFEQDLLSRKFLACLTPASTHHLIELFYLSSKTTLPKLKNALDLTEEELKEFIEDISPLSILSFEGEIVNIDKDAKKKIESFLEKFAEDFCPGIEYFQSLLKQVPINILPNWYPLPRSCDSIFQSLKERIFYTPTLYIRHIQEIESDDYPVQTVVHALLNAPNHTLSLEQLLDLTGLNSEQAEEFILFLEFNFVAVICYEADDCSWNPVLKLPFELSEYLKEKSVSPPFTLVPQQLVKPDRGIPLTFAFDLSQVIRHAKLSPIKIVQDNGVFRFDEQTISKLESTLLSSSEYIHQLLNRGIELKLLEPDQGYISLHKQADQWLLYSIEKQALSLYKALWIQGNSGAKQAEKGLAPLLQKGWVLLDEVLEFVSHGKPILQRGREGYVYDLLDEVRMTRDLLNILFESGIIEWGKWDQKTVLRLTELGSQICR
ncbi:MAG: hypothetical protein ACOYK9_00955 [Chlamydiia bacterium]